MEFWYAKEDLVLAHGLMDGKIYEKSIIGINETPSLKTIYVSTGACFRHFEMSHLHHKGKLERIGNAKNRDDIFNLPNFPKVINHPYYDCSINEFEYGHERHIPNNNHDWKPYKPKPNEKIFIINGMGTGLGDGMAGIRALQIFEEEHGIKPILGTVSMVADRDHCYMYESNGYTQRFIPITLEELCEYDSVIDLSALSIQEDFNHLNFIDFYLKCLGIDPDTISDDRKQNNLHNDKPFEPNLKEVVDNLKARGRHLIGLKLSASTPIRSLNREKTVDYIIEILKDNPKNHILLFDNDKNIPRSDELGEAYKKRYHVVSHTDYYQLLWMIKTLDELITVDTCFYHISNSYDIPTLVLFTTIEPELRLRYYPNCVGIDLCPGSKLKGKHMSIDDNDYKYHYDLIKNFKLKKHLTTLRKHFYDRHIRTSFSNTDSSSNTNS